MYQLKEELERRYSIKILTFKADVSNEKEVKQMIEKTIHSFSKIDCLINNAVLNLDGEYSEKTSEEFNKVLNTNLIGSFLSMLVSICWEKKKASSLIFLLQTV